ncbi:MAG: glycosyltransferase family 4 protein [Acidimicrobiales bacterium]|nr:glycosyltransferase family 4 protein [Acidimicrobiales bacterium]HRW39143.1 glycosyltransferase family 4 protein [Aquihabitans sp.]
MKHLLVTNDFPPKLGGIQSYLWELWRRLPADEAAVLTTPYEGSAAFDAASPIPIERIEAPVMAPTPALRHRIERTADRVGAELVVLDPALPLGHLGPRLSRPYGVVLHGAEITVPGRVPGPRHVLGRVLRGASVVIAAGGYPADEGELAAGRGLPVTVVPPGVDVARFVPLDPAARATERARWGVAPETVLVASVSRLVPRKGMDVLIRAAARLAPIHPELEVLIGGTGRDEPRLRRLIADLGAPVRLVGRIADEELPAFYGAADVFAMGCRNRWLGLEQEGFGIVFLEAAAAGVPQIAGRSGGAHEAVEDGVTGLVVDDPRSVAETAAALRRLLIDPEARAAMGAAARQRAVDAFSYDLLAERLRAALAGEGWR